MRSRTPIVLAFAVTLAVQLGAQHPAGLLFGMPPSGLQSTTLAAPVGSELMARIPAETYRGFGEFSAPASHRILGVILELSDVSQSNGELFDVHVYLEEGLSNLPTIRGAQLAGTTAIASVLDLSTPAGVLNHRAQVMFAAPVDVPIGRDLFVSLVPRTPGLRLRVMAGSSAVGTSSSSVDGCGAGLPLGQTYCLLHAFGLITSLGSGVVGWQAMVDLLVDGTSGIAVSARAANQVPTASMYSGLHPDARQPSNQTARHDIPGYVFRGNAVLPPRSPVFLLGSIQPFLGRPWIVLQPGSAILHLSPVGLVAMGMAVSDAAGDATLMWPVPRTNAVNGAIVRTQAFGFDVGSGAIRNGAAVEQRF
ncbi:MAG: hypothetical protein KDC98_19565 [Planctomycetes bacterium]|nr:hypothetical protein [Planctomycetota bacterium]